MRTALTNTFSRVFGQAPVAWGTTSVAVGCWFALGLLSFANVDRGVIDFFCFDPRRLLNPLRWYSLFTYCLVQPSFGALMQTFPALVVCGTLTEKYLGRRKSLALLTMGLPAFPVVRGALSLLCGGDLRLVGANGARLAYFGGLFSVWLQHRQVFPKWGTLYIYLVLGLFCIAVTWNLVVLNISFLGASFWAQLAIVMLAFRFAGSGSAKRPRYSTLAGGEF